MLAANYNNRIIIIIIVIVNFVNHLDIAMDEDKLAELKNY